MDFLCGMEQKNQEVCYKNLKNAEGGSRTRTGLTPADFESAASSNSATPAILNFSNYILIKFEFFTRLIILKLKAD